MTIDWALALAGCACVIGGWSAFASFSNGRRLSREAKQLRNEMFSQALEGASNVESLKQSLGNLQTCMQSTDEVMRESRLNRSVRAQAFEMLRAGVSPDTAASKLGIARREMTLLARVSRALMSS